MTDKERVITHFKDCIGAVKPFDWWVFVRKDVLGEAVALLKERRTGHWVFGNTTGHSWMKCSNCCVSQDGQNGCWSYCPNCGASMEEEVEHEDE